MTAHCWNCLDALLASAAGLGGVFKAWLSDYTGVAPDNRFTKSTIPYVLVDGTVIADNYADLVDGSLSNAINKTEQGSDTLGRVWTATKPDGLAVQYTQSFGDTAWVSPNSFNCGNWTVPGYSLRYLGGVGDSASNISQWTETSVASCNTAMQLYCFEQ